MQIFGYIIIGNIIKGRDFIRDYNPEIFKFLILSVHYRSILNFNEKIIDQTIGNLIKIYSALQLANTIMSSDLNIKVDVNYKNEFIKYNKKIDAFLNNDLNTPGVFGVLFDVIRKFNLLSVNKKITSEIKFFVDNFLKLIDKVGTLMGLFNESKSDFIMELNLLLLKSKSITLIDIENKIDSRNKARESKNYVLSDKLRDELLDGGIELKDNPDGTTNWSVKI